MLKIERKLNKSKKSDMINIKESLAQFATTNTPKASETKLELNYLN